MSEATKPVDAPIVPPTTETPVVDAPTTETKPTEDKPTETADPVVEISEPTAEEAAPPAKEEVKPVEEGTLGYKGPGLFKSVFAQKKFFWFGSDPVDHKSLGGFLRGEKPETGNHTVAWASHTGNGLLFFSKKPSEKATPAHVFNLSEVSDVTPDALTEFHFLQGGHKHTFIAANPAERDNWVSVLKAKIEEAKTLVESVKETEAYKNTQSTLTKPFVAATAAAPKKSTEIDTIPAAKEEAKEEGAEAAEAKEEKKEEKKEVKEEKKAERKSRSASRKRASIFGSIGFGKKEEKPEVKEEAPAAATAESSTAPADPVAPAETAPTKEESPAPAAETTIAAEPRPTPAKRNSIFDTLKNFPRKDKKAEEKKPEEAPVVAKEVEPVSETAPVIPPVESNEPLSTSVASPSTAPVEETPATTEETKPVEAPAVAAKSDKRKSSLPWLSSKKKETTTSDEEGEKPLSPFAKLRATVKGKSSPKAEKAAEKTPEPAEAKKEEPVVEGEAEAPKKEEPAPVATATPQVAATA